MIRASASTSIAPGEILLAAFPLTDLSSTKRRPAVALWASPTQADSVMAFISSQNVTALSIGEVPLLPSHTEFARSGLVAPSKIKVTKLVTLSRSLLTRRLGRLGPILIADVEQAIVAAFNIDPEPYRSEGRREERQRLTKLHQTGGIQSVLTDLGRVG